MYDYSKLKGRIREYLGNDSACSEKLGIAISSMSMKLNSQSPFSLKEMDMLISLLSIPKEEIYDYFFTKKVEKNSTKEEKEN